MLRHDCGIWAEGVGGRRGEGETGNATYEEDGLCFPPAGVCVFLAKRDEFFGESLGFFGFVPGGGYGFMSEEGGDEIAEEGLSVGRFAAQMAILHCASGHGC